MKKFLFGSLLLAFSLALGLMIYGAYLNYQGENNIAQRMENRSLLLRGAKASRHEFFPRISLDVVVLQADNLTDVNALIDGQIDSYLVGKNQFVQKGQPICLLKNEDLTLKLQEIDSQLLEAEAKLRYAEDNYNRYRRLWEREAASAEKLDAATAEYRAAVGRINALNAAREQVLLSQSRQTIVSPVDGWVQLLYIAEKSFVRAGTPVAVISAKKNPGFAVTVKDAFAELCPVGESAYLETLGSDVPTVVVAGGMTASDGNKTPVKIESITPDMSQPSPTRRMELQETGETISTAQTYTNAALRSAKSRRALLVPLEAMLDGSNSSVMIFEPEAPGSMEGTIKHRSVETGLNDGAEIEILSGLDEGDVVITSGREGLEEGIRVTVKLGGAENE